ncbi:MAG: MFS transporter [Clostridiales bacterium]|nr:MFS transporter [Clostridiales bacterium]
MQNLRKKKNGWYKWVIVALCFTMVFVVLGFCNSTKSLYIKPITEHLNVERSIFAINEPFRYVTSALINLVFGFLIAKFGAKKLIIAGFISLISSMLIYTFANNVAWFCLGSVFLGLGISWTTTTMVSYVITKWCKKNKGTIMGGVLAASGIGGAVAIQILSPIINGNSDAVGYKIAYFLTAIILLAVGVLITIFYKEPTVVEDEVKEPDLDKKPKKQEWIGIEFSSAIKKPYFYAVILCVLLCGLVLHSIYGVLAAYLGDVGIDANYSALVLSVFSVVLALSKFLTGFFYDKLGVRFTAIISIGSGAVSSVLLALVTNSIQGKVLAMSFAVLSTFSYPLETIMLPIFAHELFGEKSFGKILGIFVSAKEVGYALGSPLIGLFYDLLGSYTPAFWVCAVIMIIVLIVFNFIISSAKKERKNSQDANDFCIQ